MKYLRTFETLSTYHKRVRSKVRSLNKGIEPKQRYYYQIFEFSEESFFQQDIKLFKLHNIPIEILYNSKDKLIAIQYLGNGNTISDLPFGKNERSDEKIYYHALPNSVWLKTNGFPETIDLTAAEEMFAAFKFGL